MEQEDEEERTLFDLAYREDLPGTLARLKELARSDAVQSCFSATK